MESALIDAARAFRRAEHTLEKRRLELAAAIADATVDGVRQADIVRITGYTREHIRRILRSEADRRSAPF